MRVIVFGATGMVGQGVVHECLRSSQVSAVTSLGRSSVGITHQKLTDIVHADLFDYAAVKSQLRPFDACVFALGTPSAGKDEASYSRITYELTLKAAQALLSGNSNMSFVYISGQGADSSESSRWMWARVRGRTENALKQMPFRHVHTLRPGVIVPMHGAHSKTPVYRLFYAALRPLLHLARVCAPHAVTTTEMVAQAALSSAKDGHANNILSPADFASAAAQWRAGEGKDPSAKPR